MIHRPYLAVITVIREIKLVYMSREAEEPRLWRTKDSNSLGLASTLNVLQNTHAFMCTHTHTLTYIYISHVS